jgi:hypothetical protein
VKLAEAFQKELSPTNIETYQAQLGDIPADRLKIAFNSALKRCRRFPTIAEIREFANEKSTEAVVNQQIGKYCQECYPDGWVLIPHPTMGLPYKVSKRCRCQNVAIVDQQGY